MTEHFVLYLIIYVVLNLIKLDDNLLYLRLHWRFNEK